MEKRMLVITPLCRKGQPDGIAKVAVFPASDDVSWVTGERITVAGSLLELSQNLLKSAVCQGRQSLFEEHHLV